MKYTCFSLFLLCFFTGAYAQSSLIDDIKFSGSSSPTRLTVYNNKLFFFADDGIKGNELWSYDGSTASLAYDVFTGPVSSAPIVAGRKMAVCGYHLYFAANNDTAGYELYGYDGNQASFTSDIWGGPNGSGIDEMVTLKNKAYFRANNGLSGSELWGYDPVNNSSYYITDINPGAGNADPSGFTVCNDKLFFSAFAPGKGNELYAYDPVTDSTSFIADIYPGDSSSNPQGLFAFGNNLYFSARTPTYGRELYMYDGSTVQRLTDLNAGSADGIPATVAGVHNIYGMWNTIFFAGNNGSGTQLFRYDPAGNTGVMIATINPLGDNGISGFINYANKLYFVADDGIYGSELWAYDNINAPSLAADIYPGNTGSSPSELTVFGNDLVFSAMGANIGTELYKFSDAAASVQNIRLPVSVSVYPVPASDAVTIKIKLQRSETLSVSLTQANGKNFYTASCPLYADNNEIKIPLEGMSTGYYFFSLTNELGLPVATGRILKQ